MITTKEKLDLKGYVASRVKYFRILNDLSQGDVSKKLGVSRTSVSNIESGRHALTMENLEALCNLYGVKSTEILPF